MAVKTYKECLEFQQVVNFYTSTTNDSLFIDAVKSVITDLKPIFEGLQKKRRRVEIECAETKEVEGREVVLKDEKGNFMYSKHGQILLEERLDDLLFEVVDAPEDFIPIEKVPAELKADKYAFNAIKGFVCE